MIKDEAIATGRALLDAGNAVDAVEPLRKGMVFTDRILGIEHPETVEVRAIWSRALDEASLSKLRFRVGDHLKVSSGPHAGKTGVVERIRFRHLYAYILAPKDGELFEATDQQVERDAVGDKAAAV